MSAWPARGRTAMLVMHEHLSHGLHGTSARLELHHASPDRIARLSLHGWHDGIALGRLRHRFEDLTRQGVRRLIVDLTGLRHVDYRLIPALTDVFTGFEARSGTVVVCGLSNYLRDLFRLTGCEPRLKCWPSADDLIESPGELAS